MPDPLTAVPPRREPDPEELVPRVDLAAVLREAARGRFPTTDGGFSRSRPWRADVEGAVALTGHAVLVVGEDVTDERLVDLGVHGLGGAHEPRVALALAGRGEIGVLDVLLVSTGTGGPSPLVERPDLARTDRVEHARAWREDVRVYGLADPAVDSVVTLSRGIAGLPEIGIQAEGGSADTLLDGVRALLPDGELLLASVTPGNARSLRFFLRRGFVPVGSEQLWRPERG